MDIDEQLAKEIFSSDPNDLFTIRQYVAWVKVRRKINHLFYPAAHWVTSKPKPTAHWIGR